MLSRFAFAFFAIFYPSRYFLIAMLCLFLTFWMSTSSKAYHSTILRAKKLFGLPVAEAGRIPICNIGITNRTKIFPYFLVGFLHSPSRTGVEPNCPTAMHFRIFRHAFARKIFILLRKITPKSIKNAFAGGCEQF